MPHKNNKKKSSFSDRIRAFALPKRVKNFKDEDSGATALEFAMLAGPFFILFMAIVECSLLFFAGQLLESSVDSVGRKVRVGAVDPDITKNNFRNLICDEAKVLFDCNKVLIDMQVVATYADLGAVPEPNADGEVDESLYQFTMPGAQQIVMLTATYEWPVLTNYMAKYLSNLENGNSLLYGVAVFRTEPFDSSSASAGAGAGSGSGSGSGG